MGRDKALLPFGRSTFLNRLIALFLQELASATVVLGRHAELIRESIQPDPRVRIIVNEDYDLGMLSSLQTGLRTLDPAGCGCVFTLVDHPSLQAETLRAVARTFLAQRPFLVIPRYRQERGHPVAIARPIIDELLRLEPSSSPKHVIRKHRAETRFLDLDDPSIVEDIDRPEDLERAAVRFPAGLRSTPSSSPRR